MHLSWRDINLHNDIANTALQHLFKFSSSYKIMKGGSCINFNVESSLQLQVNHRYPLSATPAGIRVREVWGTEIPVSWLKEGKVPSLVFSSWGEEERGKAVIRIHRLPRLRVSTNLHRRFPSCGTPGCGIPRGIHTSSAIHRSVTGRVPGSVCFANDDKLPRSKTPYLC